MPCPGSGNVQAHYILGTLELFLFGKWRGFNIMSRRLKMKEKVMHLNEAGSVIYRCCLFPTNLCSKPVLVSITWCSGYRRRDNLSFSHWGRVMIITIRGATSKHEEAEGEIFFFGRSVRLIYDSVSFCTFSFGPRVKILRLDKERRRSGGRCGGRRIECVESHRLWLVEL